MASVVVRGAVRACGVLVLAAAAACSAVPDPANEVPFGAVDIPAAGSTVPAGQVVVGGWAMDDAGIEYVRIFVNRKFVAETRLTVPRPDLIKAFPGYLHGTEFHGWNVGVTLAAPGAYEILAQATDTRGATRDLGVVAVTVVH
jgi:hypothetical protein